MWEDCTVVPLSTGSPPTRLGNTIADSNIKVILVTDKQSATTGGNIHEAGYVDTVVDVRLLVENRDPLEIRDQGSVLFTRDSERTIRSSKEAYIYYTSGSSGSPKGIASGHEPMLNRLGWMWRQWPFKANEVCCQRIDHVFIDFVSEMFGPLCRGLSIVVVPVAVRRSPVLLADFIRTFGISRITLVPTLAQLLIATASTPATTPVPARHRCSPGSVGTVDRANGVSGPTRMEAVFPSVTLWVLSGEALPWSIARGLSQLSSPEAVVLNLYGSTEVAADITFHSCTFGQDGAASSIPGVLGTAGSVPIGRPISGCGTELIELSDDEDAVANSPPALLRRIPPSEVGRVGALYVFGAGLATGYWGQPVATKTCFPVYTWNGEVASYRLGHDLSTSSSDMLPTPSPDSGAEVGDEQNTNRAGGKTLRFFRTGDLASYERCRGGSVDDGADLVLVYRGRLDQQVKVHGQRLDLGEVEASLMQTDGVVSAAAVALSSVDADDRHDICYAGRRTGCLIGALVSPNGVNDTDVLTICRRNLPSFAVPQVIVTTAAVPTLSGSGKVDRLEVKRMLANALRRGNRDTIMDYAQHNVDDMAFLIRNVVSRVLRYDSLSSAEVQTESSASTSAVGDQSDIFVDVGLSSIQAVRLVHELRRRLYPKGDASKQNMVGLVDLYECPTASLLAQRLVASAQSTRSANSKQEERADLLDSESKTIASCSSVQRNSISATEASGIHLQQVTPNILDEVCLKMSKTFLKSEPLLKAGYARCRATAGPVAGAIVQRCYRHVVRHSTLSVLRTGGRVLVAIDDKTGKVVGFTVGIEMVDTSAGSGFQRRSNGAGQEGGNVGESHVVDGSFIFDCPDNVWRRCMNTLFHLPLRSVMDPISAVINELLDRYHRTRGWAYAAGEILYISETGYGDHHDGIKHKGGITSSGESKGVRGVRGTLVVEALERRLLEEATGVGYIRAVTICTNRATVHVAHELGFREIFRISPIQTFRPRRRREERSWRIAFPSQMRRKPPRQDNSGSFRSRDSDVGRVTSVGCMKRRKRRLHPFARVAEEHNSVVLFEKVLVPRVPPDLFLGRALAAPPAVSPAHVVRVASRVGGWKLVPLHETAWDHRSAALAILADALPALGASGHAVQYMTTDGTEDREAFVILTAKTVLAEPVVGKEAAGGTASSGISHPTKERCCPASISCSGPTWSVVGCVSWRRGGVPSISPDETPNVNITRQASACREDSVSSSVALPWREILVLALDQRWRYRGVGTSIVRRIIADSIRQGDRRLYVRSLAESVAFYERLGFHEQNAEGRWPAHQEIIPADEECLLVYEVDYGKDSV